MADWRRRAQIYGDGLRSRRRQPSPVSYLLTRLLTLNSLLTVSLPCTASCPSSTCKSSCQRLSSQGRPVIPSQRVAISESPAPPPCRSAAAPHSLSARHIYLNWHQTNAADPESTATVVRTGLSAARCHEPPSPCSSPQPLHREHRAYRKNAEPRPRAVTGVTDGTA